VAARLRWAQGRTRESVLLLDRLLQGARSEGPVRDTVGYLAQRALGQRRLRTPDRARASLQEALALAAPRGYVRTFVDLGPAMRKLLEEAGGDDPHAARGGTPELGARELAILRLLAAGRPNKGIAQDLGLSPNTVKWYLKGLFEKLGVTGRAQAVARAKDLGWA